jgi:hypothetical protein
MVARGQDCRWITTGQVGEVAHSPFRGQGRRVLEGPDPRDSPAPTPRGRDRVLKDRLDRLVGAVDQLADLVCGGVPFLVVAGEIADVRKSLDLPPRRRVVDATIR